MMLKVHIRLARLQFCWIKWLQTALKTGVWEYLVVGPHLKQMLISTGIAQGRN